MSDEELIRACAELNDGAAWSEFVCRFHRPISLSVIRTCYQWGHAPRQLVDDLVQETHLKLCADKCRQLLQFAMQHPDEVLGYIKRTAINVVHDYFKSTHSQKRGSGQAQESLAEIDPKAEPHSLGGPADMEREVLLQQIDACLGHSAPGSDQERDRIIFWLHYRHGMSAKAIAAIPGIGLTAKGVDSAIRRLTRMVRDRLANRPDDADEENGTE